MLENWYPGMMVREEKRLRENLKFIDLVLEVLDARLPVTSRNNRLQKMIGDKEVITILNKADLADKQITGRWLNTLAAEKGPVLAFEAKKAGGLKKLEKVLLLSRPQQLSYRRPLRLMVVGIPNVGKSTIINRLAHKLAVRTGEKPGITRGPQWIRLRAGWEMLDTPGLLSPYIKENRSAFALAAIGSIGLQAFDEEDTARWLLEQLFSMEGPYISLLNFYWPDHKQEVDNKNSDKLLYLIGLQRGCFKKGGQVDKKKAARILLKDFRRGALGRVSLEKPGDYNDTC